MKFQNHVGLDIGSTSIKLVQLAPAEGEKFRLVALGIADCPKFENQAQWNATRVEVIKKLLRDSHTNSRQAVISLPESQVYTRVVEMPFLEEPELSQAITWQAEQYIPVPLSEVVLKHQVLIFPEQGVPGAKMKVLLLAAPTTMVNSYLSVAAMAELEVVAVETEVLATIRALTTATTGLPPSLLIHIGAETTTFCIYTGEALSLVQSVNTGGMAATRAIGTELGLDLAQAEQYKRSYGLDATKLDGKVAAAVKPVVEFISAEAKRTIAASESREAAGAVRRLVLSGGGSILPGLVPYFVQTLGLEVQLADPFYDIVLSDKQKLDIGESGAIFCVSVGLAMKST